MVALPVPVRWHWLKSKNPQIHSGGFFRVRACFLLPSAAALSGSGLLPAATG
jgi:hypothetical protein